MSPRRSSRSKTSHTVSVAQHTNSSSSSVSSSIADRRSRSQNKPPSSQNSIAPRSPSSETREVPNSLQARRTRSSQEVPRVEPNDDDVDDGDGEEGEEEEITRCVCGHQDYPGMPAPALKDNGEAGEAGPLKTHQEDTGGLFIQCDECKVWQHGGCVGIMDEAMSPEDYFCEQCRTDLHTVTNTATGQTYSIYSLVQEGSPPQSPSGRAPQQDSTRKAKESRASRSNNESSAGKRRSTMNSRDAAYYEAEQLRMAIEESKKDGVIVVGSGPRQGKRIRDENDQIKNGSKRPRTDSGSSASSTHLRSAQDDIEVETEGIQVAASPTGKNVRGAAARNHQSKELREREEKQLKDHLDGASKRKGRVENRRGDESDPSEEAFSRVTSSKCVDKGRIETPPASQAPPAARGSQHKKTGRPPARRGRVGRNQYTRDRDRPNTPKDAPGATSPAGSHSSKDGNHSPRVNGSVHETGRQPKGRHLNASRTSMNDMKRRVAGILDFIGRTQVEMAGEVPLVPMFQSTSSTSSKETLLTPADQRELILKDERLRPQDQRGKSLGPMNGEFDLDRFKHLGSLEMMEVLTRKLMKWQGEYGKYGEK
ncbi:MAG: hypothetical protein Q9207_001491 [Kuettlingeria erythrocarpa]